MEIVVFNMVPRQHAGGPKRICRKEFAPGLPAIRQAETETPDQLYERLNTPRRILPAVVSGVDFRQNAGEILSIYDGTRALASFSPGEEARLSGLLTRLYGMEDIYHCIYGDYDGAKLMDFLFGERPLTLMSRSSAARTGTELSGLLTEDDLRGEIGRVDKALGNEDFVFLNKGTATVSSVYSGSCAIVYGSEVANIEGAAAFLVGDTDTIGKFLRFCERCSSRMSDSNWREIIRSLMIDPRDVDRVRLGVGISSRFVLDQGLVKPECSSDQPWERESARREARIEFHESHVFNVEREVVRRVTQNTAQYSRSLAGRIDDDDDDELRYLPHLTQDPSREAEIIVPEGIGGRYIGRIIVADRLYPQVEENADSCNLEIGGKPWKEVLVAAGEYKKEKRVVEAEGIRGEVSKMFRSR